jgi:hypothetical protein
MTFIGLMGVHHFNFLGYPKVVGFQDLVLVDNSPKCDFECFSSSLCNQTLSSIMMKVLQEQKVQLH